MEGQIGGCHTDELGKGNRRNSQRRPIPGRRARQSHRSSIRKVWRPDLSCRRRVFYHLSVRIGSAVVEVFLGANGPCCRWGRDDQARLFVHPGRSVFYLPFGYFPLRSERQTGLLFPQFGQSNKEGFRFMQPFFWTISKSTDATAKFDIETRARFGFLGELRTVFERNSDFRIDAAYFNEGLRKNAQDAVVDRTIADQTIPKDRWSVAGSHRYTIGSDWLTYSDFAAYRDDLFTRELIDRYDLPGSQEANIRRSRFADSQFGVFKNWGDTFFKGEWNFYQDFIQPDSMTLQRTPQVSFWGRRYLSGFPLEFRWRGEGVNYIRRESGDGLRLDLRPEVVLPFRLGSRFFGSLGVAPRETVYQDRKST